MRLFRPSSALATLAVVAAARERYRRDRQHDYERLATFEPKVIETPFGRVQYAEAGKGPPVLVVHGVLGFGSPFRRDPTPEAQADAFAALLDHLGVDALPVVAFSAGSSSAVQLALRHPDRVTRLVLISPSAPHPEPLPKPPRLLAPIIFSQPVFWALRLLARSRLEGMSGTPKGFVPDTREQEALTAATDSLFPVGPRAAGTIYDGYVGNLDIARYPFESLRVPTLVVAAEDDTLAPYKDTHAMALAGSEAAAVHEPSALVTGG